MTIHIHGLGGLHNCLDRDPTVEDAYVLPLLRVGLDRNGNGLRMMTYVGETIGMLA